MQIRWRYGALLLLLMATEAAWSADSTLTRSTRSLAIDDSSSVTLEAGELRVPESRKRPSSRQLVIPYYRLPSTAAKPATAIFLLAGGPGSSWLERAEQAEYAKEIAYYRTLADVVLFDQRGGGRAQPKMDCPQTTSNPEPVPIGTETPLNRQTLIDSMAAQLIRCRDYWLGEGVDLAAYNTDENAADVDALRQALGYRRITLIGGSYGSHLALHIMRRYPDQVERAVLYGVEGPDHTWDNPSGRLRTLARIAADAERAGMAPEGALLRTLARVIARLEQTPETRSLTVNGQPTSVLLDAFVVRWIAGHRAGKRSAPLAWPNMILAMDRGDFSIAGQAALSLRQPKLDTPMHYSMDCASGISAARRERYRHDPARALLGDINIEYDALCQLWPHEDLGDAFRQNVVSAVPTLIFHGDWDTATPIENAREVAAGLRNAQLVEVQHGNHGALYNLYARWPGMHEKLAHFLRGEPTTFPAIIALPPPDYPLPTPPAQPDITRLGSLP